MNVLPCTTTVVITLNVLTQMEAFCVRITVASHLMVTTDALVCKNIIMYIEHCIMNYDDDR